MAFPALVLLLCGTAAGLAVLAYLAYDLPISGDLTLEPTRASLRLESADGEVFASRGTIKGRPLAVESLPPHLVQAVLAAEDRRFYSHIGIDPRGVARALAANLRARKVREGASTITQQLAKVMFFSPERSFKRKLQEILVALWLERRLSKDEILARYLGTVYFGAGAYGIEGAARRYFDKPVQALSLSEAAMLAGLIKAPSVLAPTRDLAASRARAGRVLQAMVEAGSLDQARAAEARGNPARPALVPDQDSGRNYFADWAATEARRLLGPVDGDLAVRTTLDLALQDLAERAIAAGLAGQGESRNVRQAALVALAPDGAVLAMVGGRDYGRSQFNRAVQARRQPGSLFKLFVYLAALDAGFRPGSMIDDRPVRIGDWRPRNQDGRHRGPVSLRTAFARSINSVAVQLAEKVGRDKVIGVARDLGIGAELVPAPSLALGTSEVTLLEITAAYASFAANRGAVAPYAVRTLRGRDRGTAWRPAGRGAGRPLPARQHAAMLELLRTVLGSGTGKAAALDRPAAGKTGTTQGHRDAWFVGFTSDLVVGVWVGNDDGSPMKAVSGGGLPALIWRDFMIGVERLEPKIAAGDRLRIAGLQPGSTPRPAVAPVEAAAAKPALPRVPMPPDILRGVPRVVDTGALDFGRRRARLVGVAGEKGRFIGQMRHYIGDRTVTCRPFDRATYRCEVGGHDLSEVVLFNGGGRSTPGAPAELKAAEASARSGKLGVWAGRD